MSSRKMTARWEAKVGGQKERKLSERPKRGGASQQEPDTV